MPFIGLLYKKSEKGAVYAETSKMQKSLSFPQCFRMQITLKRNASSATAERLFHF